MTIMYSGLYSRDQDTIELSSRLGREISIPERDYFGLFPEIEGFISATLIAGNSGDYFFLVNTTKGEKQLPVSESSVNELRKVADRFESVIDPNLAGILAIDYKQAMGWVILETIYNPEAGKLVVKMVNGDELTGTPVYMDNFRLGLFTSDSAYSPDGAKGKILIVNCKDIYSMAGMKYPVINGNPILFRNNFDDVAALSLFTDIDKEEIRTPPEVSALLKEDKNSAGSGETAENQSLCDIYRKKYFVVFSLSNLNYNNEKVPFYSPGYYKANLIIDTITIRYNFSFNIEAGYRFMNNISVSLNYSQVHLAFANEAIRDYYKYDQLGIKAALELFKSEPYDFMYPQLKGKAFCEFDLVKFTELQSEYENSYTGGYPQNYEGIEDNLLYNINLGGTLEYKLNYHYYIVFSGYVYFLRIADSFLAFDHFRSKNFDDMRISWGMNLGLGYEF